MSNVQTMSLQEALSEVKLLDKRIGKAITYSAGEFISVSVGNKPVTGYANNEEFGEKAHSKHASIKDLISRKHAIKSAIIQANAVTKVTVGTEEMTIATAIYRKDNIQDEIDFLNSMKGAYNEAVRSYQNKEVNYKAKLDAQLEALYGKEGKNQVKDNDAALKPFKDLYEPHLVNPLDLKTVIEQMEEAIDTFVSKVDFALTTANVKTTIEVAN